MTRIAVNIFLLFLRDANKFFLNFKCSDDP